MAESPNAKLLPPLQARWMDALLPSPIPEQKGATCNNCVMQAGPDLLAERPFDPVMKCCSYHPEMANFLVGGVLMDQDPHPAAVKGRALFMKKFQTMHGVTPLGVLKPIMYSLLYDQAVSANPQNTVFGRSRSLKCPYYVDEGGMCGVWRHREAVCSTWYCKHERGMVGGRYFRVLNRLLQTIERDLALWACLELDITPGMIEAMSTRRDMLAAKRLDEAELAGVMDPEVQRQTWGPWHGREKEFYIECRKRVEPLDWEQVLQIAGPEVRTIVKVMLACHEQIYSDRLPDTLKQGPHDLIQILPTRVRVKTFMTYDLIEIEPKILDALNYFDGRPVKQVLAQLKAERGIEIDHSLLRKLCDWHVLVATT